jgi:uncharacterized protein YgiM (DUF1202 family)
MMKAFTRLTLVLGAIWVMALNAPRLHADGITFTVTVPSASLRAAPAYGTRRAYSVFQGQTFTVNARSSDNLWARLDYPSATDQATWIWLGNGTLTGDLNTLPVASGSVATSSPTAPPTPAAAGGSSSAPVTGGVADGQFTVTARSSFVRSSPNVGNNRIGSVFKGQAYGLAGQTADGQWMLLNLGGGAQGWIPASFGQITGQTVIVILNAAAPSEASASASPLSTNTLPSVSGTAREIYQRGLSLGNNPRAFSKVGDCMSTNPYFLAPFDKGEYRLGPNYAYLQDTISNFAGSFGRESLTAKDGLNPQSVLDPLWANPRFCQKSESPLACELRVNKPSIIFVSLGTNGAWQSNEEYEGYLRQIITYATERGVLPILSTKADNREGGDRFNQIVLRLAGEDNIPLWHFQQAAQVLPNGGRVDEYHLGWGQAFFDQALTRGWQIRNLTALQALDAVWKGAR